MQKPFVYAVAATLTSAAFNVTVAVWSNVFQRYAWVSSICGELRSYSGLRGGQSAEFDTR